MSDAIHSSVYWRQPTEIGIIVYLTVWRHRGYYPHPALHPPRRTGSLAGISSGKPGTGDHETAVVGGDRQGNRPRRRGCPAKTEPPPPEPHPLGTPRDDLDRFLGLYGDPDRADEHRTLWVAKSCDGYLVAGPSWGDASPWWMSMSDTVFEATVFGGEKLRFEFPAQPQTVVHQLDYLPNPLPRVGPLPDGWQQCIQPLETGGR